MMCRIKKMYRRVRRFAHRECGGTLAELAILVPFLVVMMAAVVELGRFFQTYTTLSKATRSAARYLSNHPYTDTSNLNRAKNLVICGKLAACASGEELVKRGNGTPFSANNVCIEYTGAPNPETVTVRIARAAGDCADGSGEPFIYAPIFDVGGLLGTSVTLALPFAPGTTMYYMLDN